MRVCPQPESADPAWASPRKESAGQLRFSAGVFDETLSGSQIRIRLVLNILSRPVAGASVLDGSDELKVHVKRISPDLTVGSCTPCDGRGGPPRCSEDKRARCARGWIIITVRGGP
jgi:hypothetical protein